MRLSLLFFLFFAVSSTLPAQDQDLSGIYVINNRAKQLFLSLETDSTYKMFYSSSFTIDSSYGHWTATDSSIVFKPANDENEIRVSDLEVKKAKKKPWKGTPFTEKQNEIWVIIRGQRPEDGVQVKVYEDRKGKRYTLDETGHKALPQNKKVEKLKINLFNKELKVDLSDQKSPMWVKVKVYTGLPDLIEIFTNRSLTILDQSNLKNEGAVFIEGKEFILRKIE